MKKYCIVVTGLPGSGKTTVATEVARILEIPLIDKDDILENLFEKLGTGGTEWRFQLSRGADLDFITASQELAHVVLVSHWRPQKLSVSFGTPVDWIPDSFETIIELLCHCPLKVAALRFKSRLRHPGHNDEAKTLSDVEAWLREYDQYLPIGIGERVVVNTADNEWRQKIKLELKRVLDDLT